MISCNLKGGLGNQLFQISATYSLARENDDVDLYQFDKSKLYFQGNKANQYLNTIYKKIKNKNHNNLEFQNFYNEQKHSYIPIEYKPNLLIDGYFQSEKYFLKFKHDIIDLFDLTDKKEECLNFLSKFNKPLTSIHIRRGDYLPYSHIFKILDIDYYNNAIKLFPNHHFLIFSFDKDDWIYQNFKGDNFTIINFEDEITDFTCMSLCENNIIANSTFSWWSAYLNKNINKKVVCPEKYFELGGPHDQQDMYPKEWIKI